MKSIWFLVSAVDSPHITWQLVDMSFPENEKFDGRSIFYGDLPIWTKIQVAKVDGNTLQVSNPTHYDQKVS